MLLLSVTKSCLTLHDTMDCGTPGFPVPHHLPEFTQVNVHCIGYTIQPSHPLSPPSPPALSLAQHQGLFHIRYPKYWSISISPSNEYSGLTSFRIDWFDLLAVQGTLKSLLQHRSLKASILRLSAFCMLSPPPPNLHSPVFLPGPASTPVC